MSNPQNILGKFNSYAYHHILMACNSMTTANALTETTEITTFQHAHSQARYAPRFINNNKDTAYVVLIDSTTDARFFITDASWENIMTMNNYVGQGNVPQSTTMSLDGTLDIVEPLGANFLNVLVNVCNDLETDPVGLVFVLKTIFVGHKDDGTTELISNIKPLLFINYDITSVFNSSGAQYKMQFVGAVNGLGKLPHVQKIFEGLEFEVNISESLHTAFERLTTAINEKYILYKKQAIEEFSKTYEGNATQFFDSNYRDVEYRIIADDVYKSSAYRMGDNEKTELKTTGSTIAYNFGLNAGIEDIINKLMASSVGVNKAGVDGVDGTKYIYKIVSGLNSTNTKIIVEYYIKQYEIIEMPYEAAINGDEYPVREGQSIEFDYIFTGNNVDIKTFDIKMEMGMAFFQLAASTDALNNVVVQTDEPQAANAPLTPRPLRPLFLGSRIKDNISRNTSHPSYSSAFQAILSKHAALENIEAKMVIYGNPTLLAETLVLPKDLKNTNTIMSSPTLAKVNIKMPKDANDVNTEYVDFWYKGYYTIFGVKNVFSGGVFTQELDMLSIPVESEPATRTPIAPTPPDVSNISLDAQADNTINAKSPTDVEEQTVGTVLNAGNV